MEPSSSPKSRLFFQFSFSISNLPISQTNQIKVNKNDYLTLSTLHLRPRQKLESAEMAHRIIFVILPFYEGLIYMLSMQNTFKHIPTPMHVGTHAPIFHLPPPLRGHVLRELATGLVESRLEIMNGIWGNVEYSSLEACVCVCHVCIRHFFFKFFAGYTKRVKKGNNTPAGRKQRPSVYSRRYVQN